jgi:hypothetical protein
VTALLLGIAAALVVLGFVVLALSRPRGPAGWSAEEVGQGDAAQREGRGETAHRGDHRR